MRKFLSIVTILLILITSVQLWMTKDKTDQANEPDNTQSMLGALIGGDFTLTDQNGKRISDSEFRGRAMLVFFGFTSCPDICPVTVATFSKTMELLGAKADKVAPIFITVDPATDKPEVLKTFLANFDKHIIGLTGTDEEIKQAASTYKAYFAKSADAEKTGAIDHSGYIYLMDKAGKFVKVFPYDVPASELVTALQPYVNE